jgi:hypothetical protein
MNKKIDMTSEWKKAIEKMKKIIPDGRYSVLRAEIWTTGMIGKEYINTNYSAKVSHEGLYLIISSIKSPLDAVNKLESKMKELEII